MNTGQDRGERLQQRLRGAQRHEVGDTSFGLVLPVDNEPSSDPPAATGPSARATPNTSAKRKRLETDGTKSARSTTTRRSTRSNGSDPPESEATPVVSAARSARGRRTRSPVYDEDAVEALPEPVQHTSPAQPRVPDATVEEIGESPDDEPGSGKRRKVRLSSAIASSAARLLDELHDATDEVSRTTSSPLARKSHGSDSGVSRASRRASTRRSSRRETLADDEDELSPEKASSLLDGGTRSPDLSSSVVAPPLPEEVPPRDAAEPDEAEAVNEMETAQALGKKRPRRSFRALSPDPISPVVQGSEEPAAKRRRKQVQASPAKQKQGKAKQKPLSIPDKVPENISEKVRDSRKRMSRVPDRAPSVQEPAAVVPEEIEEPEPQPLPQPKQKKRRRSSRAEEESSSRPLATQPEKSPKKAKKRKQKSADATGDAEADDDDEAPIPITVQRFTRAARVDEEDPDAADILSTDVPFARSGVNTIDVLAQVCEEVLEHSLNSLQNAASAAEDSSMRKEYRVKLRALEAFQEELRTRFLDHTIIIDTLHSLRKRVRAAQKEKLGLRDEILRLQQEREQVALRMDAVRIQHEAETNEAVGRLALSTAMHDVDLAVDRGKGAPAPEAAQLKTAELDNLEVTVARVAEQVCGRGRGSTGGMLGKVREFNAFLERAFAALEPQGRAW